MGARSYVPQLGRFLQPDPIPGGSANAYSYTFGDPVNTSDPTGAYTNTASAATLIKMEIEGEGIATQAKAERQREEQEQHEAAERYAAEVAARAAAEATAEAATAAGPQYAAEEEWEEWYEEESEYEYASYHHGATQGSGETQVRPARSRKGFKLSVWIALTAFDVSVLVNGDRGTVPVVCGVAVAALGVLTIALILTGRDPWWTRTPQERKAARERGRAS